MRTEREITENGKLKGGIIIKNGKRKGGIMIKKWETKRRNNKEMGNERKE